MDAVPRRLTVAEAYEAAYRLAWDYASREPDSESLQLMLVAMEPTADSERTNDPALWHDWLRCVEAVGRAPLPRFPSS
ncbi:hypothetical protein [Actinopolymorpha sp. B9G3]|uniref:hypothetical protein n=1 Tax=Actinopolymorpha sp. B9G3 TaxID=3158970 RepID=UPI0032D93322